MIESHAGCPRARECAFYRSASASPLLRIKYAMMFPYCRGGKHESCMRWWLYEQDRRVPEDLLPDGGKDNFASDAHRHGPRALDKVLVVDDMPLFRKSMSMLVGRSAVEGVTVVEADSGESAMELLLEQPAEWIAVVTDYNMGGMTGYELTAKIRAHPSFSGLPVIIFSSEMDAAVKDRCLALPRVRWLNKRPEQEPFDGAWRDLVVEHKT